MAANDLRRNEEQQIQLQIVENPIKENTNFAIDTIESSSHSNCSRNKDKKN